jgi:hypothetical protein
MLWLSIKGEHMALADPQVITVATVAQSMPRIKTDALSAIYQKNDKSYTFKVSHQESGTRVRSLVRVDYRAVKADPLTSANQWENMSVQTVIDRPMGTTFSATEVSDLVAGLSGWLTSTNVGKLYGEES